MISASKATFRLNNIKIFRLKVKKNLTTFCKKFCESPPRGINVSIPSLKYLIACVKKSDWEETIHFYIFTLYYYNRCKILESWELIKLALFSGLKYTQN